MRREDFCFPLTAEEKTKAISTLLGGKSVYFDSAFVVIEDGYIWGTDAYGCDVILNMDESPEASAEKAIKWAEGESYRTTDERGNEIPELRALDQLRHRILN